MVINYEKWERGVGPKKNTIFAVASFLSGSLTIIKLTGEHSLTKHTSMIGFLPTSVFLIKLLNEPRGNSVAVKSQINIRNHSLHMQRKRFANFTCRRPQE